MESCGVTNGFVWLPQRLATVGCAFRAAARHEAWHGGRLSCLRPRRRGCAPGAASCGEPKAQIAKQPICQARTLEGKTGDPTGPCRAVERSIYRTLAPLAPGTHEPVSQEGGQPNVQSEACATRLSTVRRARHREAAPRDAVAAPARSLARDPAQKGSQTSAGKWAAATSQPSHETLHTRPPHTRTLCLNYQT